jgi:hypothetical protein
LTNVGLSALDITAIAFAGADPGDFSETNNCGSTVSAGSSCSIEISFTPGAQGTLSASLTVSDGADASPQTVTLSGVGTDIQLTPTSLNFGNVTVGTQSQAQTVTLTNHSTSLLNFSQFRISPQFAQTNNCSSHVLPGASCSFSVTFTPTSVGVHTGNLQVVDNGAGSPQTVPLRGTGVE